ncbi:hypothetical protein JCM24511_00004 [Saitozyma sp. JCM 24511]|nr:hypothetical protein JCM24511_00004 [Saitozyma sp. JCM 24511]
MSTSRHVPSPPEAKKGRVRAPGMPLRRGDACLMCRAKKLKCSATKPVCDECARHKDHCMYGTERPPSRVERLEYEMALARRQSAHATGRLDGLLNNPQMSVTLPRTDSINPAPAPLTRQHLPPTASPPVDQIQAWLLGMDSAAPPEMSTGARAGGILSPQLDVHALAPDIAPPLPDSLANSAACATPPTHLTAPRPVQSSARVTIDEFAQVFSAASNLSALQLDGKDIPQSAPDYLLDMFFAPPREALAAEAWTETQFRAKLALPPHQRPHSCLLYAMCTVSASSSHIPLVRALADSFYAIAAVRFDEAIRRVDRLLDAIKAAKTLSKWLYSRSRPLEGYQLGWKAVSLALACQLHIIPSGLFSHHAAAIDNNAWPLLGPPKDQWELGERIHTFWAVWGNDRAASLMVPWPSGLSDEVVTTPLPLATERYDNGTAALFPDVTIPDLYTSPEKLRTVETPFAFLILATHLVHRAQDLRHRLPEVRPVFSYAHSKNGGSVPSPAFCPRKDHPMAYAEMMSGVENVIANLPDSCCINALEPPPWTHPDVPMIHVMVLSCRMLLHDVDGEAIDRDICLSSAREIAGVIKLWIRQLKSDEPKHPRTAILHDRNKNGLAWQYGINPWYWTADRLMRGAKVLRRDRLDTGAQTHNSTATSPTRTQKPRSAQKMQRRLLTV